MTCNNTQGTRYTFLKYAQTVQKKDDIQRFLFKEMILNRKGRNTLAWSQHPFPTNHPLFMEKQCNWIRTIPKFTPYYRMTQILTEFSIHNHNIQSHPSSQMFDLKWFRNQRAGRKQGPDGRSTLVCTWPPPPQKKSLFKIKKKGKGHPNLVIY